MKKLIVSLFGGPAKAAGSKRAPASSRDNPLTIEDGSDNATRRQLVQVLLRDALRKYGIPPRWIDCQMMLVSSRSRGPGMYVRLVVRQWDDRLLNYAQAFQTALMVEITRFEPQASQWLHGISWQLEVSDTCPYRTMPDKSFWADPVTPPPQISRVSPSFPIEPLFPAAPEVAAAATAAAAPILASLAQKAVPVEAPSAAKAAATGPDSDAMKDLERLFKIRDEELSRGSDNGAAVGYESTQPSPL